MKRRKSIEGTYRNLEVFKLLFHRTITNSYTNTYRESDSKISCSSNHNMMIEKKAKVEKKIPEKDIDIHL